MRSLLVELSRLGKQETGILQEEARYLIAAGTRQVREVSMPLDHEAFIDLMQALRYRAGKDARQQALETIRDAVTKLLRVEAMDELETGEFPLQIDLVLNPAELAALPFEAAADRNRQQLAIREDRPVVITRRVRNDASTVPVKWPAKPRVLFAWAWPEGSGASVPWQDHESGLQKALEPWAPLKLTGVSPNLPDVLTVLPRASLDSIREACLNSVSEKRPFTHVHLLAHGYPVGEGLKQHYGLALHAAESGDLEAVAPDKIAEAVAPLRGHTAVLSLTACDSANVANTIIPRRSIAHELHLAGFPVVIASQLPLTVPGSTVVVEAFYSHLLASEDVRDALRETRRALSRSAEKTGHDWASLVAYVRLPEDYLQYLHRVRLESVLSSLKSIQSWSDELIAGGGIDQQQADYLVNLLQGRSAELQSFLTDNNQELKGVVEENYGLLGSTDKRIAEMHFEVGRRRGGDGWQEKMRASLERAQGWYQQGFDRNPSHHWTGAQCLSIEAALTGRISDPDAWGAALFAARKDVKKGDYWGLGSIAELYLIAPAAGREEEIEPGIDALRKMKRQVGADNPYPLQTTKRQFQRYVSWWTNENGFFPSVPDLAVQAQSLIAALDAEA